MSQHIAPSRNTAFLTPGILPGLLSADVAASLLAAAGDVTFILTRDGTILDVAVAQGDLANHGFTDWIGGSWIEALTVESRTKAVEMLQAATGNAPGRWRQVNHHAAGGEGGVHAAAQIAQHEEGGQDQGDGQEAVQELDLPLLGQVGVGPE